MGGARKTDSMIDGHLTLFDELHENRVVPTDGQPKAVLIFLNDHASLNQPWRKGENKKREKLSYEGAMKIILLDCQCLYYSIHQERPIKADYSNNDSNT